MNNKNKQVNTPKIRIPAKPSRSYVIRISALAAILIALGVSAYLAFATDTFNTSGSVNVAQSTSSSDVVSEEATKTELDSPTEGTGSSEEQIVETIQPVAPVFSFVDTSQWIKVNSRDSSFSIKYISNLIYATCPDLADNLMIAMAGPTESDMNCGSLQKAVSMQPYGNPIEAYVLRTQTAIAQTDDEWNRSGATATQVNLVGGQVAQRYEYDSTILDMNYRTIEYTTVVNGKRYVAVNNWQYGQSANMSAEEFDTLVQKTWIFN